MASNLSSIGFTFATGEVFQSTMLDLADNAIERLGCTPGDYAIWRSRSGAEIWFHLGVFGDAGDARDIEGLTPFFEGDSAIALRVVGCLRRPGDNAFEGALQARMHDDPAGGEGQTVVFEAVDFAAHADRQLPFECEARLVGFALAGTVLDAGAANGVAVGIVQAPRASGEAGAHEPTSDAASQATITGSVVEHRRLINEVAAASFDWLSIDAAGSRFDVVAEPGVIVGAIEPGALVQVACTLFGRLID